MRAEVHACTAAWAFEEANEHAGEVDTLLRKPEQPGDHEALARDVMRRLRQADSPWQLAASVTRACALVVRRSGSEGPDRAAVDELADGANELDYRLVVVLRADINGRVSRGELAVDGEAMSAIQSALVAVRVGRRSLDLARGPRLAPPLRDAALKRAHEAFKGVKRAVDDVRRGAGEERAAARDESE